MHRAGREASCWLTRVRHRSLHEQPRRTSEDAATSKQGHQRLDDGCEAPSGDKGDQGELDRPLHAESIGQSEHPEQGDNLSTRKQQRRQEPAKVARHPGSAAARARAANGVSRMNVASAPRNSATASTKGMRAWVADSTALIFSVSAVTGVATTLLSWRARQRCSSVPVRLPWQPVCELVRSTRQQRGAGGSLRNCIGELRRLPGELTRAVMELPGAIGELGSAALQSSDASVELGRPPASCLAPSRAWATPSQ